MRSCSLERQAGANEIAGRSVNRSLAEHKLLRERCESILVEARSCLRSSTVLASGSERSSLQRIEQLAAQVLEGDVFATSPSENARSPVPEAVHKRQENAAA